MATILSMRVFMVDRGPISISDVLHLCCLHMESPGAGYWSKFEHLYQVELVSVRMSQN